MRTFECSLKEAPGGKFAYYWLGYIPFPLFAIHDTPLHMAH